MLERHVRLMRTYLSKTMVAAGFAPGDVAYEQQGRYFTIDGSSIEVASGAGKWILREVFDTADLQDGGVRPVVSEVARFDVGHEMTVAREAALLAVRRRIDTALEESA
jgi:hypothetical protein